MKLYFIFILSAVIGTINAIHGSGYLRTVSVNLNGAVKWGLMPILFILSAYFLSDNYYLPFLFLAPYAWKMATGTGGEERAYRNQTCDPSVCIEWVPFDKISAKIAKQLAKYTNWNYCQRWGFGFAMLSSIIFMFPFIFTNPLYSLPLLSYPFMNRYLTHRDVEFLYIFLYTFLFLASCA